MRFHVVPTRGPDPDDGRRPPYGLVLLPALFVGRLGLVAALWVVYGLLLLVASLRRRKDPA